MGYKILLADDDRDLLEMLGRYFEMKGYQILQAGNGTEAVRMSAEEPDLILLDINMPGMDGLEVCRKIRGQVSCPILFLTARVEEQDRVNGLMMGGDDYITKPFEFEELNARIQAVIRRFRGRPTADIKVEGLIINPASRSVSLDHHKILLSPKEYDILEYIASQHPRVISNYEIAEHVYDEDFDPFSGVIRVHMANIRKKLMLDRKSILCNEKGKGYYLCHP